MMPALWPPLVRTKVTSGESASRLILYTDFQGATRRYNQEKTLIETGMAAGPAALVEEFSSRERARSEAGS